MTESGFFYKVMLFNLSIPLGFTLQGEDDVYDAPPSLKRDVTIL